MHRRVAEHLLQPARRKVLLPYVTVLAAMMRKRLRKQARTLAGSTNLVVPHFDDTAAFRDDFALALDKAWSSGAADFIGSDPDRVPSTMRFPTDTATYVNRLLHGMDETTSASLQEILAGLTDAGVDRTKAHGEVIASLRKSIDQRASMVAETEVSRAFNRGMLNTAKASGIDLLKRWSAEPDACEICVGNAEDGAIPVDDEFSSGDAAPPSHPNCRCACEFEPAS